MNNLNNNTQTASKSLANWAIKKPVTTIIMFVSLLILGIFASRLLPLEKWPGIDIPELYISVPYPNSTPAEVERQITKPVEEALATISGIQQFRTWSKETGADISIQFKWDENINAKSIEAREKIDAIRDQLPDDLERIMVFQFNTNDMPVFNLRISSDRDLSLAYDLLERNLKRPIERVAGVSQVTLYGVDKRQISIRLDENKIASYRLNLPTVVEKLRRMNFSQSAGYLNTSDGKIMINPNGKFESVEDVYNLYIEQNIKLGDIANIQLELPERQDGRHLHQTYAIGMDVMKESGANLVQVASDVMEVVNEVSNSAQFNGINLFVMQNTAEDVTNSLSNLLEAGLIGALLSVIVLYLFLRHVATTIIVVLSVPFAIFITLGAMYMLGYSLNILSLMGLMLAVGMLVDNAVVVTESIFHERQNEKDQIKATNQGVQNVSLAVIAGTCTTAIVFLPNIIGKKIDITIFLEHVAIAICISLFASLFIAQTLIPLLTSKIKNIPIKKNKEDGKLMKFYQKSLNWVMNHQKKSFLVGFLLFASMAIPMGAVTSDEADGVDNTRMFINYQLQKNYSKDEVEKIVNRMEDYLYANQDKFEFDSVYSYYTNGYANSVINLKKQLTRSAKAIKTDIEKDWPTFVRARPQFGWGGGNGGGIQVTLKGNATEVLMEIADQLIPVISNIEGLEDVNSEVTGDQKEIQIIIDRERVQRIGLSSRDVAQAAGTALRGLNLRTYRDRNSGEIQVRLMFAQDVEKSLERFRSIVIHSEDGIDYRLDQLAELKIVPRLSQISRFERQTSLNIGANMAEGTTLEQAKLRIEETLNQIQLPTGYSWSLNGSFERQREAESVMEVNMLLALAMIYIVMAALFESLILPTAVITSLLFSISGLFWALMLTGTSMSIMVMIGILILMGIVVNNGIVLVDRINQLREQGYAIKEAVLEGSRNRIRPILMTVATTVLGLLPLAVGNANIGGAGSPEYSPMAIAIMGGLMFSTVTSLYFIPLAYVLLLKLRDRSHRLFARSNKIVGKVI
ncbi:efflux RND transporter permease subunit [Psychrosphaera sp. B3R10]|uniref:efflux RND transporter permease subunit n=1 Tax=unclassified Psychrosphaera TaxID=2641570 RepID=UPI001C0A2AAD|nr:MULTISPECIES: efflux RND transporter permease subunit [unclassified Psychrosphaera]MBU2882149.1 efflux RND transporter permease subunit [Psychrosphaera sp. I2R16]MBU2988830.1 efflux RND transporter permease subunit [Psychrosphaera sp. B3R10]MDO6717850.1 efflux RND transporter permease subunit [Psychrosphaera sp. 1_MG-2023]